MLYWNFSGIKEWCLIKANIYVRRGVLYFGDRRIKCLQSLVWWLAELTMRGKYVDLSNFNDGILSDTIE